MTGTETWTSETWTYAGIRADRKGKRYDAWYPPGETEALWYKPAGHKVIGGQYTLDVARKADGGISIRPSTATYAGKHPDDEFRAGLEADDRIARIHAAAAALERSDDRRSALDEALEPLLAVAARYAMADDLDALKVYVNRRIDRAWSDRRAAIRAGKAAAR